jgi:hypothetical protein
MASAINYPNEGDPKGDVGEFGINTIPTEIQEMIIKYACFCWTNKRLDGNKMGVISAVSRHWRMLAQSIIKRNRVVYTFAGLQYYTEFDVSCGLYTVDTDGYRFVIRQDDIVTNWNWLKPFIYVKDGTLICRKFERNARVDEYFLMIGCGLDSYIDEDGVNRDLCLADELDIDELVDNIDFNELATRVQWMSGGCELKVRIPLDFGVGLWVRLHWYSANSREHRPEGLTKTSDVFLKTGWGETAHCINIEEDERYVGNLAAKLKDIFTEDLHAYILPALEEYIGSESSDYYSDLDDW